MKKTTTALLAGTVLALNLAGAARADSGHCAPRERVVERLTAKFGETRQSVGIGTNNSLVEVFASDDTGTWTITVTQADGTTCLVASGQAFETLAEVLPTAGSDA